MKTLKRIVIDDEKLAQFEGYAIKGVVVLIAILLLGSSLIALV